MKLLGVSFDINDEGDRATITAVLVTAAAMAAVIVGGLLAFL